MDVNKKLNRRQFLKLATVGTCGAICHNMLLPGRMLAYALPPFGGKINRIIEVFFYGGCCGYGLMPGHNNGAKAKYPTLYRTPEQATPILNGHPDLSLHQAFQGLVTEAGQHIAVVLNTGNPVTYSRSHEDAQNANQRIDLDPARSTGMGVGAAVMAAIGKPLTGIAFGGTSQFMSGGPITGQSIGDLRSAGRPNFNHSQWFQVISQNVKATEAAPSTNEQKLVGDAIAGMETSLASLQSIGRLQPQIAYPNTGVGRNFADINRMVLANVGNIFFVPFSGFDTHSNQATQHQNLFSQLSAALTIFVQNLKLIPDPAGGTAWDTTAIITRTDFGRTVENNAQGTDHGMTQHQLIIGGSINGGVYGEPLNEQQYLGINDYTGRNYVQFSTGQPIKELVEIGMGITNAGFPIYPGNRWSPIGFI